MRNQNMKIAVVLASNRPEGVSEKVLNYIQQRMAGRAEIDPIRLREYVIHECDADNACATKLCGLNDDCGLVVDRLLPADGIIYMPTIQGYGVCSQFQRFIERSGYGFFRPMGRPLRNKIAGLVVVGRRYGHVEVYSQIMLNMLLNEMIVAGSGFPPTFYAFQEKPELDPESLEMVDAMLDRMIEMHGVVQRGSAGF